MLQILTPVSKTDILKYQTAQRSLMEISIDAIMKIFVHTLMWHPPLPNQLLISTKYIQMGLMQAFS